MNQLKMLALGLDAYHEINGSFPTDSHDEQGRPLLSWRVHLLPYIEEQRLHDRFHLNEPWDSPHNRQLISQVPRCYRCPSSPRYREEGFASYLAPSGARTFMKPGGPQTREEIQDDRASTIALIEVDREHEVIWTRPGDLDFDPARPHAGLGERHVARGSRLWGVFALFVDGKVHLVPADADDELVRALFTCNGGEPIRLELPWYEACLPPPLGFIIGVSFLISFGTFAGSAFVLARMLRRQLISPGEILWLVASIQQLALVITVMAYYRFRLLPFAYGWQPHRYPMWLIPSIVSWTISLLPFAWFPSAPMWMIPFVLSLGGFFLAALDALSPHPELAPEEVFFTGAAPVLLASMAALMALMTITQAASAKPANLTVTHWPGSRTTAHWAGIVVALLPLAWFIVGTSLGLAELRYPLVRVRE